MEEMNYYNQQAYEILQAYSNDNFSEVNNTLFPQQSFLTFDPNSIDVNRNTGNNSSEKSIHHDLLLFFLQYLIAFPIFLLCWIALVSYLRRMGHITQSNADSIIEELKDIKITHPHSILK